MAAEVPGAPPRTTPPRTALAAAAVSLLLWAAVAAAGPSAASPDLGPGGGPPFDLGLHPSSAVVSVLLAASWLLGGTAVLLGLAAVGRGWRPRPGRVLLTGGLAALVVLLVPPVGSADHLSYAAYGRIAALGGDPYVQAPDAFAGGSDPVASAVRAPWRSTPSVYGPVGTALQALASLLGGPSVRATVWWGQALVVLAWTGAAFGLDRALRDRPAARARAGVLWTLNPLLLTVGAGGAHVDVLAGAAALAALLLAPRRPLLAGLALGVAVGTKLPYGAVAAGVVVAWVLARRRGDGPGAGLLLRGAVGALVVLVPAHVWAGAHAYDQTRTASRYVSLATVWRPLVEAGLPRGALLPGTLLLMAAVAALWWRRLVLDVPPDRQAAGVTAVLALGYLVAAPYELPWYDLLLWGPLALVAAAPVVLERVLVVRLTLLAVAYVPGLVEGMSPAVEAVTLGYRREAGPWIAWAALVAVLALPLLIGRRRVLACDGA
ncbi:hypothetical protein [Kineococcus rubinsiae]|uniref:hypothetical protein n=1 Tax=Kineococcus rubinsiae TaxID=2609562 RepID=UPI001431C978|nr:hypothetical protein [Kineococcus rubinsiae]NIZ91920.1 hypothetical protein [Kineococcus rubinsiae]